VLASAQVRTKPWYEPQYFITILGMVLGNCISSISVGLSALLDDLTTGATSHSAWP
jgi:putative ABC transport system permease protein